MAKRQKQKKYRHIHIGTGRFSLGFVGYFSHILNFSTIFLNRDHDRSHDRNRKLREQKEYLIEYYDIKDKYIVNFDDIYIFGVDLEEAVASMELISDLDTILLTTSVGSSQLQHIAPIIAGGLKNRLKSNPLFIMACENGHRCSQMLEEEVKKHLSSQDYGGVFVDCVVDQICHNIEVPDILKPAHVIVSAESYREWIVEDKGNNTLRQILIHPLIKFVSSNQIDLYELRKLWLVNGFHLAIAVLGVSFFKETDTRIAEVIKSKDEELLKQLNGVQKELVEAFIYKDEDNIFKRKDIRDYISKIKERFRHSPDTFDRILQDALLSEDRINQVVRQFGIDLGRDKRLSEVFSAHLYECIFNFFEKTKDRIYDPVAILVANGYSPDSLSFVLQELVPFLVRQGDRLCSKIV